ncbi:MAG: response regulator [Ignavibacteriales bacterium]|nr:response regulator [Ignavibacteriales bacterium]
MAKDISILVVDDDASQVELIAEVLEQPAGYRILQAQSASEAMNIARKEDLSLIISDYYMPEEDGFSLCTQIKRDPLLCHIMFVLLTGATEVEKKVKGFDLGADDYITKPFHADELRARVKAMLRLRFLQEELEDDKQELSNLYHELEKSFEGILAVLTDLIGLRVPNAPLRAQRAVDLVRWMGDRLGLAPVQVDEVALAARIHEIGKIQLPDNLIRKPLAELSEQERTALNHFPVVSQTIISGIPRLQEVGVILKHQLENFDGSGFPDHLSMEQIPMASRLLRVANFIEQVTSAGPMTMEQILEQTIHVRGTILDPRIVQLLDEYLRIIQNPSWMEHKKQISIYELTEGMTLANDLATGKGTKLLPKNTRLSRANIDRILAHNQFDPIINNVYVFDSP